MELGVWKGNGSCVVVLIQIRTRLPKQKNVRMGILLKGPLPSVTCESFQYPSLIILATIRLHLSSFSNLLKAARTKTLYLGLRTPLTWQSDHMNAPIGQILPRCPELHEHQATLLNVPQQIVSRA